MKPPLVSSKDAGCIENNKYNVLFIIYWISFCLIADRNKKNYHNTVDADIYTSNSETTKMIANKGRQKE